MKNQSQNYDFFLNRQFCWCNCVELNTSISPLARSGQLAAPFCQGSLLWRQKKHIAKEKWCRANPCCKITVTGKYFIILAFPQRDCWKRLSICSHVLCCFVWQPPRAVPLNTWIKASQLCPQFWPFQLFPNTSTCPFQHLPCPWLTYTTYISGCSVTVTREKNPLLTRNDGVRNPGDCPMILTYSTTLVPSRQQRGKWLLP